LFLGHRGSRLCLAPLTFFIGRHVSADFFFILHTCSQSFLQFSWIPLFFPPFWREDLSLRAYLDGAFFFRRRRLPLYSRPIPLWKSPHYFSDDSEKEECEQSTFLRVFVCPPRVCWFFQPQVSPSLVDTPRQRLAMDFAQCNPVFVGQYVVGKSFPFPPPVSFLDQYVFALCFNAMSGVGFQSSSVYGRQGHFFPLLKGPYHLALSGFFGEPRSVSAMLSA